MPEKNKPAYPIELLAPARDAEVGRRAIDCGADAVYIAADRFGAREQAGNTVEDIARLADYAHTYWAKVYVTVNTILFDHEIPEAEKLIRQLYEIKADGVIIQDMGLLELDLPPIPLIASTQMNNRSLEHIRFLENIGFRRVILARETTLEAIEQIRRHTSLELEFFLHGALCVCYSGQCYLSYALGGRSGNRGQCAQPCRKSYTVRNAQREVLGRTIHALSLKDLSLDQHLDDLLAAGVTSFKIEGRLKDSSYVMNVVSYYRRQLDERLPRFGAVRASSGITAADFTADPVKTFNRGYTTYFLKGRQTNMAARHSPKSIGEKIGVVASVSGRSFQLEHATELHAGDGLCWYDEHNQMDGTSVQRVEHQRIFANRLTGLKPGTVLYRNHDHLFQQRLLKSKTRRTVRVHFRLSETATGFLLQASDEDQVTAALPLDIEKQLATSPLALETIRQQLVKSGDTLFQIVDVAIEMNPICFMPLSVLNQWRREVLFLLQQERLKRYPLLRYPILKNEQPYPVARLSFRANVLNTWARKFYQRHGVTDMEPAAESGQFPEHQEVMTTRYCLRYELGRCNPKNPAGQNQDPLFLTDDKGRELVVRFDCTACEMKVFLNSKDPH